MSTIRIVKEWLKGHERRGREALLRAAVACIPWRPARPAPDALRGRPLRVLFVREGPLGDLLVSLGAVRAIAASHRDTRVDVLTTDANVEALRGVPYVRRAIAFPRNDRGLVNAYRTIRRLGPYDAVVDGMLVHTHVRTRAIAMMLAARAPYWVGERGRRTTWIYNLPVDPPGPGRLHLERQLRLAEPFLGAGAAAHARPLLSVEPAERAWAERVWTARGAAGRRVMVNVSVGNPTRRWPDGRFAELLAHLRHRDPKARVVVTGLPREATTVRALAEGAGAEARIPTLRELIALVATAELVISPDTAVCHLASAFATPLVSLHVGGTDEWWPYATPGRRVVSAPGAALDTVPAAAVTGAVDELLGWEEETPAADVARPTPHARPALASAPGARQALDR
ncbi:MAG: glycosyltransferase family 9 protein [Gemmatimonadota bacterium]|nr:glycosyltransferase family 9 protein [Gemmatimonadota bacterium]